MILTMTKAVKKNFNPRIRARMRKNKQIIIKNIDNLFEWIKGAELIELKKCNTQEDPIRPELDNNLELAMVEKYMEFNIKMKFMLLCVLRIPIKYQNQLQN